MLAIYIILNATTANLKRSIMPPKTIIAGILQFRPRLGEVTANLTQIEKFVDGQRFDLLVLPELATTGYNFTSRRQLLGLAETTSGISFQTLEKLAVSTRGAIVWGVAEKAGRKIYNSAVLTTPEGDHHIYRKSHLFFREKLYFDPGDSGFKVYTWRGLRLGLMICFDWIFPEVARSLALQKCRIICHPSNLILPYCQDAMITRCLENRLFAITANRIGSESASGQIMKFTGKSQIVDPSGRRLLTFNAVETGVKTVKIMPAKADTKRVNRHNDLFADRRVDIYRL